MQGRQEEMVAGQVNAGFPSLLGGVLDQPLGVRGMRGLVPTASRAGCEISHRLAGEVLSIPIYGELTEAQRLEVVAAIAGWL